jgi:translation initiation factor 1 (eIF-1/SUI1)
MSTDQLIFSNNTISFDDNDFDDSKIIIFSEKNGRKSNTYIVDWNIEKEEMKNHLKNLKKKYGCNGSIKMKLFQGDEKNALHLQGELKSEVKDYILSQNINEDKIEIKI